MKSFVIISAICLQLGWGNAKGFSNGVGAFSYQDSSGTSRSSFYDNPIRFGGFPNMPRFPSGFPFHRPMPMPNFGMNGNGAFASALSGPGYNHQIAAISPSNPNLPNIVKTSEGSGIPGGYRSVSVSSYSSSSDINGHKTNKQGSKTYIDDNGKITDYSVDSP